LKTQQRARDPLGRGAADDKGQLMTLSELVCGGKSRERDFPLPDDVLLLRAKRNRARLRWCLSFEGKKPKEAARD